jgi:hypothetical protein
MSADDEGFRDFYAQTDRQSASVIQIDNGKALNVVAICAAFCGLCLGVSIWAAYTARDAATEARLSQYYLLELDAKMVNAGINPKEESVGKRLHKEPTDAR